MFLLSWQRFNVVAHEKRKIKLNNYWATMFYAYDMSLKQIINQEK